MGREDSAGNDRCRSGTDRHAEGETMKPGNLPVGSPLSRAAARSLLRQRRQVEGKGVLVRFMSILNRDNPDLKSNCRHRLQG